MTRSPSPHRPRAERWYRRLLRAWPRDFRERYGDGMTDTFLRHLEREGELRGRWGETTVWIWGLKDAAVGGLRTRLGRDRNGRRRASGEGSWVSDFVDDVKFALRSLVRRPVLAVTAIITLALGIGANAAIFSVTNGIVLRPLPYPEADRLVMVWAAHHERGWTGTDINIADAWDFRTRAGVFEDLAVLDEASFNMTGGDRPEVVSGVEGTWNLFDVFGVQPRVGRAFLEEDGQPDAPPVAVISDGFWERRFARDPQMLGSTIILDDRPTTIVGILPDDFVYMESLVDVFLPMRLDPLAQSRNSHSYESLARLRPGTELATANRAVNDVALQLQEEYPDTNEGWTADVTTLRQEIAGDVAMQASVLLTVVVGFVLLMACVNVANLLLARADSRKAELAVRSALGAGRGRILRQLMTESLVMAVLGGGLGWMLAVWGNRFIVAGLPEDMPPIYDFSLDGWVVGFTALITVLSAVVFGLTPAWRAARGGTLELRSGGRTGQTRRRARFGSTLVVVQTALAVMLLVGGGMMVKSVNGMMNRDFGWEADGLLTLTVTPPASRYEDAEAIRNLQGQILERLRATPGVEAAGAIQAIPLGGSNWSTSFTVPSRPDLGEDPLPARIGYVSDGYFETMGLTIVRGRTIDRTDTPDGQQVAVVNETFAERYFPDDDVLGEFIQRGDTPAEIVGVVEDHVERGVDRPMEPGIYQPVVQNVTRRSQIAVRTSGEATALADAVRQAVWDVDPDQPISAIAPMQMLVDRRVGGFRLLAQLMAAFALLSLVLGAVGIYGVTAHAVGQRTNEIGIRMAMGADRGAVRSMVLGQGMRRTVLGVVVGVGLALLMGQGMAGLLIGVSPTDPATFGTVVVLILAVAGLGSYLPARRASAVDPVEALSSE